MSDHQPVTIIKEAPSDKVAKQVLVEWFKVVRPAWKLPADICAGAFFTALSIYYLTQNPLPFFFYLSFPGAVLCFFIAFGYIPLLAKSGLQANKRLPSYYKRKTYRFYQTQLVFETEGEQSVDIPYEKFSKVSVTQHAILFLVEEKLALWFSRDDISTSDFNTIVSYLEKNQIYIDWKNQS